MHNRTSRGLGCLFGGAFGDSLGAAVEFMSRGQILRVHGPDGIQWPAPFMGLPAGAITDDTQQAIALCEGLTASAMDGFTDEAIVRHVWLALKRWYRTQDNPEQSRAPGGTSMGSLSRQHPGTFGSPLNRSNSCGSLMRVHPVGILFAEDPDRAFAVGMVTSVLTHGGREACLSAGAMAEIVARLCRGDDLEEALESTKVRLASYGDSQTLALLLKAMGLPTEEFQAEHLASLGEGWDAPDALAISVYAARCHPSDFVEACRLAVNHSGDSDSTGSICGAILGALHGLDAIPREWRNRLERRDELVTLGNTLSDINANR